MFERLAASLGQVAGTSHEVSASLASHDPPVLKTEQTPVLEFDKVAHQGVKGSRRRVLRSKRVPVLSQAEEARILVAEPLRPAVRRHAVPRGGRSGRAAIWTAAASSFGFHGFFTTAATPSCRASWRRTESSPSLLAITIGV